MIDINFQQLVQNFAHLVIEYVPKIALAIITLVLGFKIIKAFVKGIVFLMTKHNLDTTLQSFLSNFLHRILQVVLLISVADIVGIETSSFVALLGAMGLAFGLALQGSLQNFAGGVLIIFFKPFRVGDYVKIQDFNGTVKEIQIFNTILTTPDRKTVILPNGAVANDSIVNFSIEPTRRVEFIFGVSYQTDIDKAKAVIRKTFEENTQVLDSPSLFVEVSELAESSVNIMVRAWCKNGDYDDIYFAMHERIKKQFDIAEIQMPYPQADLHLYYRKESF